MNKLKYLILLVILVSCKSSSIKESDTHCYCYYYRYYNSDEVTCKEVDWSLEDTKAYIKSSNKYYPHVSFKLVDCKMIK